MIIRASSSRRAFLASGLGTAGAMVLGTRWGLAAEPASDPRVRQVLADTIGIDMHNHVYPTGIGERSARGFGAPRDQPLVTAAPLDLSVELNKAGLTAVCASYELDFTPINKPGDARNNYLRWIDALDSQLAKEKLRRAFTLKDLQAAHASRQPTLIQAIEGAHFIEGRLERIEEVYRRGLRHLQPLHDQDDMVARLGDTDNGRDNSGGLTAFGAEVIKECNRLGILIDLAHGSPETILAAAKIATQPFIMSHTGASGSVSTDARMGAMLQSRLLNKERAKVVADAGGVIGVWVYPVDSVEQYVKNLRAMVELAGVDHVGIGSDSNILSPQPAKGTNVLWPDQKSGFFYAIVAEMLRQGFTPSEIGKLGGGNYCRVFDRVTAVHA